MMTVSGFDSIEQAECRAAFYRSHGYRVVIIEARSERAGTYIYLRCIYGEA